MARNPERNYLRAWREHRHMTQARLAEAVGTTGAVISLLESGDRGLSDKWLRKLAPVLGTRPGHLLEVDPEEASSDILEIWADIPEEQREQARDVLKTFRRKREAASAPLEPAGQAGARGGGKGPERI
jgi:transcriptional regulator with XRE-family HTH domain